MAFPGSGLVVAVLVVSWSVTTLGQASEEAVHIVMAGGLGLYGHSGTKTSLTWMF